MAVWETDDEASSVAATSLPSPTATLYRTPSRVSRRSRRSLTPPGGIASSPPPSMPMDKAEKHAKRSSKDVVVDEHISILDPRRFTPTLHANLVSEILALRRDQEEKLKTIESLESSLHSSHQEQETLQADLTNTTKESRSVKRQLALLEGGSSSALGELARERDEAVDAITETRRRLDVAQKKVRIQEEDSQRVHDLWSKEKDEWEEERRRFERKIHIAESRLKVVLDEVANLHAAQEKKADNAESENEDAGKENDAASEGTQSRANSIRFSVLSGPLAAKMNGHSLADELDLDDDDDYMTDPDGRQSVLSHAMHTRNLSRDSVMTWTHRRNQSSESVMRPGSVARGRFYMNSNVLDKLEGGIREDDEVTVAPKQVEYTDTGAQFSPPPSPNRKDDRTTVAPSKVEYTDTGVQFTPPASPKMVAVKPSTPESLPRIERLGEVDSPFRGDTEVEANQSRKRVHINRPPPAEPSKAPSKAPVKSMTSSASQTLEPLSPPRTPKSKSATPVTASVSPRLPVSLSTTVGTQTDAAAALEPPIPAATMQIPSISVIPPTTRPSTPQKRRLPQYMKDAGCQVVMPFSPSTRSMATQTDEIRVDRRLDKLPRHLHPSVISSRPSSPSPVVDHENKTFNPVPGHLPPRNPRRLTSKRSFTEWPSSPPASPVIGDEEETHDAYPGNNDDGPLSQERAPVRRPHRISSLFAGFDAASSDEGDELADGDHTDTEFRTALSAPKPSAPSGRQGKRTTPVSSPEQGYFASRQPRSAMSKLGGSEVYSSFSLENRRTSARPTDRSNAMNSNSRANVMRKAAMIQSGIASHSGRSRSPSLPDILEPPFPIPTRASSRQPPFVGAPSDGQRSPTRAGEVWHRRGVRGGVYRSNSIRKVRSATALPRSQKSRRQQSRSPPQSPSEEGLASPDLPPLPTNDITTPRHREFGKGRYRGHRSQPSTTTAHTENTNTGSVGSSQQASGVVDAIAQTMVGEWMFKYVRRRKSFGMSDGNNRAEENSNDRHRRWVWLAPYERAILWSSKQPTSGGALMGKSGRKLTIQSVLDVKDDNPPPKGTGQIFNRSILILTPQRALKFTAASADRHYLWLMSLSFLAHSQQAVPEILASPLPLPMKSAPAPDFELSRPKPRKAGIRDSIRLTKGKNPSLMLQSERGNNTKQLEEALTFDPDALPPIPSHQRELSGEAAEPPFIPRFHERSQERVHERPSQVALHGRKRSNTGGHVPPPLSFRGLSSPNGPNSHHAYNSSTAGASVDTAGSSDIYNQCQASGNMSWAMSNDGSRRTSEASSRPTGNFFEAIGTVRMEAFISPLTFPRFDEHPDEQDERIYRARRRSKEARRRRSRSRHRDSYTSRGTRNTDSNYAGSRIGDEDYFRDDPFKGF